MRCAIASALILVTAPASAQVPFPPDSTLQGLLQQLVNGHGVRGVVVGLLDENGTRRVIAHGDPGPGTLPLDGESLFEIGSMTKVFTGLLLADMVRRGEVELTDLAADLLPSRRSRSEPQREAHHAARSHHPLLRPADESDEWSTCGQPHENPYVDYTVSRMYEFLSSYELPRDPGDSVVYLNIGVALLGHALSLRAGMTLYDAKRFDRILRPLGMTHTAITLTPQMRAHLVRGHDRAGGPVANWDLSGIGGDGRA